MDEAATQQAQIPTEERNPHPLKLRRPAILQLHCDHPDEVEVDPNWRRYYAGVDEPVCNISKHER